MGNEGRYGCPFCSQKVKVIKGRLEAHPYNKNNKRSRECHGSKALLSDLHRSPVTARA